MRATLSGYYRNLHFDQSKTARELFDVTKQISSGQKIQYAHEDTSTFIDTVRLDNEITTLTQAKQNAQSALQVSTNTDTTMNDMTKILDTMKVKLVSAANESHSPESLNAIALELRGLEENLRQLANTSINGNYLFSGSEIKTKPIDDNGIYQGNAEDMKSFLGSGVEQTYNINGQNLFLGDENDTQRKITLNMPQFNQTLLYPDVMEDPGIPRELARKEEYLTGNHTVRDLMGDTDPNIDLLNPKHHFYIHGTTHDGTSFKTVISKSDEDSIQSLLDEIGYAFGNSLTSKVVDVTLNEDGQIEIEDRMPGSSKLDFHMVGATDFDPVLPDNALVTDVDALDGGETDFKNIADDIAAGINPPTNPLHVKSFMQSSLSASTLATNNIESLVYDRNDFVKEGVNLSSNVPQIVKNDNSFATDSTKLHEVFSGITYDFEGNYVSGLDLETLTVQGLDVNGNTYDIDINFSDAGSTVSGTIAGVAIANFPVEDVAGNPTNAGDMTYRQLMDVVNFAVTGTDPNGYATYEDAIRAAKTLGEVNLSYDGKVNFKENGSSVTQASIAMFDPSTNLFSAPFIKPNDNGPIASFNANNALTISDPKTDFFKQIDEAITSVELGRIRADGNVGDPRNGGVQNAIQAIDDLANHLFNQHSVAGVQSQTFQTTSDRTDLLIITTKTLRSDTIDVDFAEASLELKQLEINYQAMLSTVTRISELSLVNYL